MKTFKKFTTNLLPRSQFFEKATKCRLLCRIFLKRYLNVVNISRPASTETNIWSEVTNLS